MTKPERRDGMDKPNKAVMPSEKWKCVQCGRCCMMYGCMIPASDGDLARWEKEGRKDILEKAKVITDPKTGRIIAAELWFNPATGREYIYCPWIKRDQKGSLIRKLKADKTTEGSNGKVICLIHGTKPQYCRDYICRKHLK